MIKTKVSLLFFLILFLFSGFSQNIDQQRIKLSGGKFYDKKEVFYPMIMNYQVNIYTDDEKEYWVGPHHGYSSDNNRCCHNQTDALMAIFSDFARIKEMGFNSIRLCGIEMEAETRTASRNMFYLTKKSRDMEGVKKAYTTQHGRKLASMINAILNEAHELDLKVVVLTGRKNVHRPKIADIYGDWLALLADSLKNNPALLAYDLYNEPIYSSSAGLNKNDVVKITENWHRKIIREDKNALITYGIMGHEDVMIWDPSLLKCDFLSFHLYPQANNFRYVEASIKWIRQNINKPWIIGETGYSGNDTAVTYPAWGSLEMQKKYAEFILENSYCCGAIGFSWWVYKDVFWGSEQNWFGLIDYYGQLKPASKALANGVTNIICNDCIQADDLHYFRLENCNFTVTGSIEDEFGRPMPNAVIYGWNKKWEQHVYTFSDNWGKFKLCSANEITYVKASAQGKATIHKIVSLDQEKTKNIGRLELKPYNSK
jgi:hypothetical protein